MSEWTMRIHGPDNSSHAGYNAKNHWIVRIMKRTKGVKSEYMDSNGNFHLKQNLPTNDILANDTHIPIETPSFWQLLK